MAGNTTPPTHRAAVRLSTSSMRTKTSDSSSSTTSWIFPNSRPMSLPDSLNHLEKSEWALISSKTPEVYGLLYCTARHEFRTGVQGRQLILCTIEGHAADIVALLHQQNRPASPGSQANRQLLGQRFAKRGLARPRRTVQEHNAVPGDERRAHPSLGKEERRRGIAQKALLDGRLVVEGLPQILKLLCMSQGGCLIVQGSSMLCTLKNEHGRHNLMAPQDSPAIMRRTALGSAHSL